MTEKEKMLLSKLFLSNDMELKNDKKQVQQLLKMYNALMPYESEERCNIISQIVLRIGKNSSIYPPFYCDYGYNILIGENSFINVNCVILDVVNVTIGNYVLIGPNVTICTATHPKNVSQRERGYVYGLPIIINDHVWIGAGCIINPGIEIGKNSIIGAGSVVTNNIPQGVIAVGNPCKVIKKIKS